MGSPPSTAPVFLKHNQEDRSKDKQVFPHGALSSGTDTFVSIINLFPGDHSGSQLPMNLSILLNLFSSPSALCVLTSGDLKIVQQLKPTEPIGTYRALRIEFVHSPECKP